MDKIHSIDSKPNQMRDQKICEDLVNLTENKDWLQQQINAEKAKHIDLDAKVISRTTCFGFDFLYPFLSVLFHI